jgi:hypothetical protein
MAVVATVLSLGIVGCGSSSDGGAPADSGPPSMDSTVRSSDGEASAAVDGGAGEGGDSEVDAATTGDGGDGGRDYSTDRSLFFGPSRCADAGLQLCEDFESGMLDKSTWTVSGTAPVIDGVEHARGSHALHITLPGNGLSAISEKKTFPEPNDTYFGRMFVYFKSLPTPPGMTYAHWTIAAASGTVVDGEIRVSGQLQGGKNLFGVGTDNRVQDAGTGDWTNSDDDSMGMPRAVPTGEWICLEWMHEGDTSETEFWWDATLHPSLTTTPAMHGGNANPFVLPQFTSVWFGWQEYQTSTEPFELWIDEIAVDSHRIGCVL